MPSPPALTTAAVLRQDSPRTGLDGSQPGTWGQSIQTPGKRSGERARPTEPPHLGSFQQLDDLGLHLVCRVLSRLLRRRCGPREPGERCEKRLRGHRDRPAPPPSRPPGPARERAAHLPTAAAVPVPAPACLGSAAPRHPAPCRPPAPAADARRILRIAGPRPAAASGPDASAAAGTCLRRVLSAPPAATGAGRPAWPHAR